MIVATEVVAEAQVTWLVRSWVELSEKVPVAVNCSVSPLGTLGLAGVTAIDCRTAAVTVSTVEPVMPPSVALIVDVPVATPVARPGRGDRGHRGRGRGPGHLAGQVLRRVVGEGAGGGELLGLPLATLGLAGVTAIDCRTAAADRQHRRAGDAVERGGDRRGARRHAGGQPAPLVIVATEVVAEAQVTWLVRSCGRVVGEGAGGGELLGLPLGDARVGRRHRDRLQDRGG